MVHQIAELIFIYPHFFLLPQKETLAKKKGTRNMLPIALAGARPHFREANARPTFKLSPDNNDSKSFVKKSASSVGGVSRIR